MLPLVIPHYRVRGVEELTPDQLRSWGLRGLLLDVDGTLTRYRRADPKQAVLAWLEELRRGDIQLCLVSNGTSARIRYFAERLCLPYVAQAIKPLPWGLWKAIRKLKTSSAETAIVGDQLFADIMAGRLAGIRTILVQSIRPDEEPWFTRLKRLPERAILSRLDDAAR
jgi:HAD superfamily phosphatase (TIGR01668 family)